MAFAGMSATLITINISEIDCAEKTVFIIIEKIRLTLESHGPCAMDFISINMVSLQD